MIGTNRASHWIGPSPFRGRLGGGVTRTGRAERYPTLRDSRDSMDFGAPDTPSYLPHRGGGFSPLVGHDRADPQGGTSPLMGEAGRGWGNPR